MAFTCPRCGRASHHPEDARQGYCGACHDWTALDTEHSRGLWQYIGHTDAELWLGEARTPFYPAAVARYIAERYGVNFVTVPHTDSGDCRCPAPERQPEVDGIPWSDPMEWRPGDAEW